MDRPDVPLTVDPEVSADELDDDLVLYDTHHERTFLLNPTAALVWELSDGSRSVESVARTLADGYGRPYEEVLADVRQFVKDLDQAQLLASSARKRQANPEAEDRIAAAARRFLELTAEDPA